MTYQQAFRHEIRRWMGQPPCARGDVTELFTDEALTTLTHHQRKREIVERCMAELKALGTPPIIINAEDAADIREQIEQLKHDDDYLIDQLCAAQGIVT